LYTRRIAGTYPSLSVVFAEAVTVDIMLEGVVVKDLKVRMRVLMNAMAKE